MEGGPYRIIQTDAGAPPATEFGDTLLAVFNRSVQLLLGDGEVHIETGVALVVNADNKVIVVGLFTEGGEMLERSFEFIKLVNVPLDGILVNDRPVFVSQFLDVFLSLFHPLVKLDLGVHLFGEFGKSVSHILVVYPYYIKDRTKLYQIIKK